MFLIVFSLLLSGSIIPQVRSELLPGNSSTTEQSQTECPSCDALQTASPSVQPLASLTSATIDASGAEAAVQELVAAQNEMHAEPASLAHVHMVQFRDHLHQRTQLIVVGCACVVFLVGLGFVLSVRVCAKRNSHRAQVRSLMRSEHDAKTLGNISLNDPTGLTPMVTPQSSSKADNEICDGLQSGNGASESSHTGEIASMMGGGETDPELDRNPTITKIVINSGPYNDLDETGP